MNKGYEEIAKMMHENKIKDTHVEHTDIKCDVCLMPISRVTIEFEDGRTNMKETGCKCAAIEMVNKKQREINAKSFDNESIMHGDYKFKTFENYNAATESQLNALKVTKYYADHFNEMIENSQSLLMQGQFGTGKTHLAAAVRNQLFKKHYRVLFVSMPDYLEKLKESFNDKNQNQRHHIYKFAKEADLLIFDDVGANKMSEWAIAELFRLVDARRSKCTIYTTNLTSEQLRATQDLYRVFSRMMERAKPVVVDGEDHRMKGMF